MKKLVILIAIGAVLLWAAGPAQATLLNTRPVTIGTEWPGEPSLSDIINNDLGWGSLGYGSVDVNTAQVPYAYFVPSYEAGYGEIGAILYFEYTSLDPSTSFGIYSLGDASKTLSIFDTTSNPPKSAHVTWVGDTVRLGDEISGILDSVPDFGLAFGYYLKVDSNYYYSEDDLNGGTARMVIYLKPGETNEWAICSEDGSDFDYQDAIVRVSQAYPVPEPTTLLLVGGGLLGLAGLRRKVR